MAGYSKRVISNIVVNNATNATNATNAVNATRAVSASYALTASYAMNGGGGSSGSINTSSLVTTSSFNAFTSSIQGQVTSLTNATSSYITNSQTSSFVKNNQTSSFNTGSFTGSFTGSLLGTSSWATNAGNASTININVFGSPVESYLLMSNVAGTTGVAIGGDADLRYNTSTNVLTVGNISATTLTGSLQGTSSWASQVITASYVLNAVSSSFASTASLAPNYVLNSATSSFIQNSQTGSFILTGSTGTTQTISGSLIIDQNLTVLGSSSITYVTSSQLDIGTNIITVNTSTPAVRFGGLAVFDSGSTGTGLTGSILWDSQNNVWIYSNPSGASYDGAMILVGPRNSTGLGNEVGINSWYAAIGNGSHHMTSSLIWNSGSLIRLETDTQVTGSLNVSVGITSSLFGTSSWATNALTASLAPNYVLNSATSSFVQNSQTSSFVTNSQTSSFVTNSQTSSFVTNSQTGSFATTGSNTFNGNQIITGSLITSGSTTTHINDVVITGSLIVSSSGTNISNIIGGSTSGSRIAFKATNITGVPTSVSNMFSFFSNNTTELLRIGDSLNGQVDTAFWGAGNSGTGNYAIRFGSTYCYINGSSDTRVMVNGANAIVCSTSAITLSKATTANAGITGSFTGSFTGSLFGTASNADSASLLRVNNVTDGASYALVLAGTGTTGTKQLSNTTAATIGIVPNAGRITATTVSASISSSLITIASTLDAPFTLSSTSTTAGAYAGQITATSGMQGFRVNTNGQAQFLARTSTNTDRELRFQVFSDGNCYFGMQGLSGTIFSDLFIRTSADSGANSGSIYIVNSGIQRFRSGPTGIKIGSAATLPSASVPLDIAGNVLITGSLTVISGSIIMPNNSAFRVTGSTSTDITAVTTLTSTNGIGIDYNQGNNYNNTTGIYTAPVAGLYHVYMNIRVGSTNSQMQAIMYKNDTTVQLMWEAPGTAASTHFGVSGIVYLAANDNLRVKVAVGKIQFDANDSWGAAYIG